MNEYYCTNCNETLALHADGSVACGCELAAPGERAFQSWTISTVELNALQASVGGGGMSAFGHLTPNFRERADEAFYRMSTPKMAGAATKAEAVSPVAATCREHPVPYPGCPNCPEGGSQ